MIAASRRRFLIGGAAFIGCAPAIVRAGIIMPVRVVDPYYRRYLMDYNIGTNMTIMRCDVSLTPLATPSFASIVSEAEALKVLPRDKVYSMKPVEGQQLYLSMLAPSVLPFLSS